MEVRRPTSLGANGDKPAWTGFVPILLPLTGTGYGRAYLCRGLNPSGDLGGHDLPAFLGDLEVFVGVDDEDSDRRRGGGDVAVDLALTAWLASSSMVTPSQARPRAVSARIAADVLAHARR